MTKIFRPEDGQKIGLAGMIGQMLENGLARPEVRAEEEIARLSVESTTSVARLISFFESPGGVGEPALEALRRRLESRRRGAPAPVIGFTGTGGAGKSSLVDELVRRFTLAYPERSVGVLSVDPTRRRSGGALLGDRLRMNAIRAPQVFMRSLATRRAHLALSGAVADGVRVLQAANFDLILVETAGIGQSDSEIVDRVDLSVYVMTPEYGAPSQLEKIDMLELADAVVLNKFDRRGGEDALRDVKKQWRRNHPDRGGGARRPGSRSTRASPAAGTTRAPTACSRSSSASSPRAASPASRRRPRRPGGCPRRCRSCPPSAPATWPRSPRPCAATARGSSATRRRRAARSAWPKALRALGDRVPEMAQPYEAAALQRRRASAEILALRRAVRRGAGRAVRRRARRARALARDARALHRRGAELRGARPRDPGAQPRRHACRGSSSRAWRSRAPRSGASSRASRRSRTCRAASRSPRACSRSSAPARKTRRACSPARARPSAPTCASTCWRRRSPRCGSRPRSTASPCTGATPTSAPTSTARSARPASRSAPSTTR